MCSLGSRRSTATRRSGSAFSAPPARSQANEPFRQLTGFDDEYLARVAMQEYIHPEDVDRTVGEFLRLVEGRHESDSCRVESRIIRADGRVVWTQAALSLVRDSEGTPLFVIDMIQDVTERKIAEMALHENTDRLTRVLETQTQVSAVGLDLEGVMRLIVERSQSLTRARGAMIDLLDGDDL